jgi:hypothetical protein
MHLRQNSINRETLLNFLQKGKCKVTFVKVKDGTIRSIFCTLDSKVIPSKYINENFSKIFTQPENPDLIPIWDIEEGKWKSFKVSKVESFDTPDEFEDTDKDGHYTISKQRQELEERKKAAKEKFKKRVLSLQEKAEESRKNIDQARSIINKIRSEAQSRKNNTIGENSDFDLDE